MMDLLSNVYVKKKETSGLLSLRSCFVGRQKLDKGQTLESLEQNTQRIFLKDEKDGWDDGHRRWDLNMYWWSYGRE